MVFRRRARGPPITRDKHEVQWSDIGVNASTTQNKTLANAVPVADKNLSTEVAHGSHVRFVYLEFQFSANLASVVTIIHWQLRVVPLGMTFGAPSLYYQDERAYIIKRGMEMIPPNTQTVIKRVIGVPIPRLYQRMKANQKIIFAYQATDTGAINACGFTIYKEIT